MPTVYLEIYEVKSPLMPLNPKEMEVIKEAMFDKVEIETVQPAPIKIGKGGKIEITPIAQQISTASQTLVSNKISEIEQKYIDAGIAYKKRLHRCNHDIGLPCIVEEI